MNYHHGGKPSGIAKYRVCPDCRFGNVAMCPVTRIETDWVHEDTGSSRTVSGGICGRTVENYGRPVA